LKRECQTREELLVQIRTCFGGRAAEILYYGKDQGLNTGASGDLEHATRIARQMICRFGMDDNFGLISTPEMFRYAEAVSSPIYQLVSEAASRILKREFENAIKLLEENRSHLDTVSRALLAKNRLYRNELQELLPPIPSIGKNSSALTQNLATER
jgi:cell division protease FtsH